ncbi:hypothetical protein B484DRAFT_67973 [Ochromonadaceae sp. CCMP2298]|nr:hypothetical protein B484DRAFT_67973 [Ochromonadaceae sp. CCMP2298]
MALNPDLATFITLAHAPSHFKSYGSKENRECLFDWKMYVQRNPDLEGVGITTEAQALDHYVNNGKKEGRVHSTAEERYKCDWRVYLLLNPDVAAAVSLPQAAAHYHQSGRSEGRECRFDYIQYLQLNLDLEVGGVKTEAQAVAHYLAQGKKENRIHSLESAPPSALVQCSARSYLLLNPDLQNIVPEAEAMAHYNTVGKGAKRECGFDWQQYLAYNTDVFGIRNETHALEHYLSKGRAEGRIFYAPAKAQGFEWMDYLEVNPDIDPRKVFLRECVLNPLYTIMCIKPTLSLLSLLHSRYYVY